jgi:urease beta subunit
MFGEPGEYLLSSQPVEINRGKPSIQLSVANTADRAIQVGSHFHFFEVNKALDFDRAAAFGMRLNIPAGTAVRFEPGDRKDVALVAIGGSRRVTGLNGLTNGSVDGPDTRTKAELKLARQGFRNSPTQPSGEPAPLDGDHD